MRKTFIKLVLAVSLALPILTTAEAILPPEAAALTPTNCWFSAFYGPYKLTSGGAPYVHGAVNLHCSSLATAPYFRVAVQMKGGPCSNWCDVAVAQWYGPFFYWGPSDKYLAADSGVCAGTRQYRAQAYAYWDYTYGLYDNTIRGYSNTVTITC